MAEDQRNMIYGHAPMYRHYIIVRALRLKQMRLLDAIEKYHIFGAVSCWMYKTGLHHINNLIWLQEKIRANQIYLVILAEFLNPEENPELYNVTVKINIHGQWSM